MNPLIRNFRSKAKVATLAAVFLFSFSLYGLYCLNTVTEVKINGALYQRIIQGKDAVADILPPPEYLIEAYLTAYQAVDAADRAEAAALADRCLRLRDAYRDRHAYWEKTLPPGPLKEELVVRSYAPAARMLEALEARFLPAVRAGDRARALAALSGEIRPAYAEHRARIDSAVAIARRENGEAEAGAEVAVRSRTWGQAVIGFLLFAFLSLFSSFVIAQEDRELREAAAAVPGEAPGEAPGTRG